MPYKDKEYGRVRHREYMRGWYKRNRAKHVAYVRGSKMKLVQMVSDAKMVSGCIVCGYKKCSSALDFHHKDPGSKLFSLGSARDRGREQVINEMAKCDVMCKNCHAELHHEARKTIG